MDIHKNFRDAYEPLLWSTIRRGVRQENARTGRTILAHPHAASFGLDLTDRRLPNCGIRKTWPKTAAAEVAWFLMGTRDATFIRKYAPIWDKFVETYSVYSPTPLGREKHHEEGVYNAYGYRWRAHFERDQIADALTALLADSTDRQVWVQAWDPASDGLGQRGQKNVPCPIGFTLSIVGGRLNSTLLLRSSDLFVGLPYDTMGHALLMDAYLASYNLLSADDADVELGVLTVTLAHPHVYEVHLEMASAAMSTHWSDDTLVMPAWTLGQIELSPHDYVAQVSRLHMGVADRPAYSCKPEVVA